MYMFCTLATTRNRDSYLLNTAFAVLGDEILTCQNFCTEFFQIQRKHFDFPYFYYVIIRATEFRNSESLLRRLFLLHFAF